MNATARKALEAAEANLEAAIHCTRLADRRALTKMHVALDHTRAAFIILNEGEHASVGHDDDPARKEGV